MTLIYDIIIKIILRRRFVKIIIIFIHAYMLVTIYEILSEDRNYFLKWLAILLIGVTKYVIESILVTKNIAPILHQFGQDEVFGQIAVKLHDRQFIGFIFTSGTDGLFQIRVYNNSGFAVC